MTSIRNLTNIENVLAYLYNKLNWPINSTSPEIDPDEVNWEYYPEELGLNSSDFAKIETLQQMRPLTTTQNWAVFFVEFNSNRMQITALRKILSALIFNKRNTNHKIWDKENLLFICLWGKKSNRTIGFIHFNESDKRLPTLKAQYFEPKTETLENLEKYEKQLLNLNWDNDCNTWADKWKKAFTTEYGQVIRETKRLTTELARSAQRIRQQILDVLEIENNDGYVHKLLKKFKDSLVHDLDEKSFADMYAQTICYGLFSARCLSVGKPMSANQPELEFEPFDPLKEIDNIPDTNPFLRKLLREGLDSQKGNVKKSIPFDELELYTIIDLLDNTDIEAIVNEFNRQTRMGYEDPVIHFYEDFLTEYDKETKIDRGVFYTPLPVVNFIVNSVDQILKTDFGLKDGLASDEQILVPFTPGKGKPKYNKFVYKVQVLDPATGTGTFLRQAILNIKENFDQKNKGNPNAADAWNKYVSDCMLWRLNGFELMMAPYAVAHMKLAMALKATGYNFAENRRLKVFLTNSLEKAGDTSGHPSLFDEDAIAVEATKANIVKKESNINVVIGNPPYSISSSNKGEWILDLIKDYKKDLNERKINLDDDYIKFIRLGQKYIENNGYGILAYISNNSFIDGITHRQMRKCLLKSFDKIYILNLHGNCLRKEVSPDGSEDVNVFNIQQGVSINIFIKNEKRNTELSKVYHFDLYGSREKKFSFLSNNSISSIVWNPIEYSDPGYFFVPKNFEKSFEYENNSFRIDELFLITNSGIKTDRDGIFIDNDKDFLSKRISKLLSGNLTNDFIEKYNVKDSSSYKLTKVIQNRKFDSKYISTYLYRPFDLKYIYYDKHIISRPAEKVMENLFFNNYALITTRQYAEDIDFNYVFISTTLCDIRMTVSNKGCCYIFPLYIYNKEYNDREPNLNIKIIENIEKILKITLIPLDLFDYIYAILHTPNYRKKYKEFLKIDFPRIPYPKDKEQFFAFAKLGAELRDLHLMKSPVMDKTQVTFCGNLSSSDEVTSIKWDCGKVWINKTQYFNNVPENAWNFYIGGYQVAYKWLKDRKGRRLSAEEIKHYCRIIKILMETERIMGELDKIELV